MSEKKVVKVLLSQLEEALEERQRSDRRQQQAETLEGLKEDRRKQDRRVTSQVEEMAE